MESILFDISLIMVLATFAGFLAKLIKQPTIPAYILVGVLIGPVLHMVTDPHNIMALSEIGIAFLLFIVGLELDLRKLKDTGDVATIGGLLQIFILFVLGFLAAILLGYSSLEGVYFGLIIAFSSTMVVVKILSDKYELDTLHGRIIIGMLLLQDIVAILAMSLLNTIGTGNLQQVLINLTSGVGLIIITFFAGKALFPLLFKRAAEDVELLFLMAVSVCLMMAMLFTLFGFSIVIGAFVAGVILGNLPYSIEIISKVKPLKDFFSVLFFVAIGLELQMFDFSKIITPTIVFLLLTIAVSPIISIIICSLFGYKKRTAFMVGISLAQISEFSLIIVSQGFYLGHVSEDVFGITLILTLISIAITSYLLKYDDQLYNKIGRKLRVFEKLSRYEKELHNIGDESKHEVVLVGFDRTGFSIMKTLKKMKKDFIIVDFDPDVIKHLMEKKTPCIYGDIGDDEILEKLKLRQVKMVISTVPNFQENLILLERVKKENPKAVVIVTSYRYDEALELYEKGASYVIIPHYLGGEHVSILLEDISDDLDKLIQTKISHISALREREELRPKKTRFIGSLKKH